MSKFAIFGYYGQGNAGDEAILAALIGGIKSKISKATISVYSANPGATESTHGVKAYSFFPLGIKRSLIAIVGRRRANFAKSLLNFISAEVVVIGGGGLLYDTPETNKWMMGYIKLIRFANFLGKKILLVGISVGPLHHPDSAEHIGKALGMVDLISVRDKASKDLLLKCGVNAEKIHVIPDLVFTLTSADRLQIETILAQEKIEKSDRKTIALTPCSYNSDKSIWVDQYLAFCRYAVAELGADIWFIPMQQNPNHDDGVAIEKIIARLDSDLVPHVKVFSGHHLPNEVQGLIGEADFVLAERLHGTIMALNTSTPFMSIGYMPKVTGVLRDIDREDLLITMEDFLAGNYLPRLAAKMSNLAAEMHAISAAADRVKPMAARNFDLICEASACAE